MGTQSVQYVLRNQMHAHIEIQILNLYTNITINLKSSISQIEEILNTCTHATNNVPQLDLRDGISIYQLEFDM